MKNLANCKPSEFLKQTYRIKRSAEKWLKDTDIMNIRNNLPKLTPLTKDMTEEERVATFEENKRKSSEQLRKNFSDMLDQIMCEHADETLELLALCCFVEPDEVDNYSVDYYLGNLVEILNNSSVLGFFTSLAQLGVLNTADVSQA
ncbi:MAG: hypothetical protein IJH64_00250 [Oscillospiraceae bacterium]|nr:hypothetical protein [Oscillospiraceae bacterium]